MHAQAFPCLHPMGGSAGAQARRTGCCASKQLTSPCRGGGCQSGGDSDNTPRDSLKTPRGLFTEAERSHSPAATHSRRRLHSHKDHNPDCNRHPLRAVLRPLSRVAGPVTSLPLRLEGGKGTKSSRPSPSLPPPYRLGGLRPGPALLPTALFPHVGS